MLNISRCNQCVLPSTYPGIVFDSKGTCSYCSSYISSPPPLGEDQLIKIISKEDKIPYNCIVPLSGGKDSTFVVYYAKRVLNLRPIAVNYDSGFQSSLAKGNIQRTCEILGVPLVIFKADFKYRLAHAKEVLRISKLVGVPFGVCGNCETYIRASLTFVARKYNISIVLYGDSQYEKTKHGSFYGIHGLLNKVQLKKLHNLLISLARYVSIEAFERSKLRLPFHQVINIFKPIPFPIKNLKIVHFFDFVAWNTINKEKLLAEAVDWRHPEGSIDRFDCLLHPLDNFKWLKETGITKDGFIYANMVRENIFSRDDAINKEDKMQNNIVDDCYEFIHRFGFDKIGFDWLYKPETCVKMRR